MSRDSRRRLGAIAALVAGLFVGFTLLPVGQLTGPIGRAIGHALWQVLGAGALGIPLLGIGLGLAGFDRLGRLDMKRSALLVGGLSLLVPYLIGVLARVSLADLDGGNLLAHAVGVVPGFFAVNVPEKIGLAGAVLLGFLALSALTLATFAWHPLQRLEAGGREGGTAGDEAAGVAAAEARPKRSRRPALTPEFEPEPEGDEEAPAEPVAPKLRKEKEKKPKKGERIEPAVLAAALASAAEGSAELPPVELLNPPPKQDVDAGAAKLDALGQSLLETLRTFKVDATIAGRTTGPVVTQFELVPAPGVKAARILALADDLAIAMRAPSVRVAPIPGKGAVGVEVPNPVKRMVVLRELFEDEEWTRTKASLPIALGRDLEGKAVVADLAKTPHLLIAGQTGSGKSVAINTIVTSLVYRYTPKDLRLLMIDPKMVELSIYNSLPHLRHKVITKNDDAAAVLKWAVLEMNRRYELLQVNGARNLADFNKKVEEGKPLRNPTKARTLASIAAEAETSAPPPPDEDVYQEGILPFIVVIVDELADLMMTVQAEVETPLAMLAQKARAIGIHLILATQRPSVNVLTGLIKANFPSRIAFRVASKVDSRTILDANGAEALLGNGDMLFLPPGKSEPVRIQGAYIATEESERVMEWFDVQKERRELKAAQELRRPEADILEEIRAVSGEGEGASSDAADGDRDPLFRDAAEACIHNQGGSTSLLQRRLRIGYGRAARIIDQLHFAGILGPPDGSKPREVLISPDQLDEYAG
ncbi:MAG TPA: DNA translocase FtsK [Gemmatimonadales bacterium]|nr:DNA translocase FtsK [Gemmatimonadales bacterium]